MGWPNLIFAASIHALAVIGLFGVTLLPLRAFLILRRHAAMWSLSMRGKIALLLIGAAGFAAILLSVPELARLVRCLIEMRCGPQRAGGWLALAGVGFFYLAFEAVAFVVLATMRMMAKLPQR